MRNLILLLVLLCTTTLAAQQRTANLIFDDEAYNLIPRQPAYSGSKYNNLPISRTLRPYAPVPIDQGPVGSCVGQSVGYGAFTISKAIKLGVSDRSKITHAAHSGPYIYNQIKSPNDDCDAGSRITEALALVSDKGVPTFNTFGRGLMGCSDVPGAKANQEANAYQLKDYATIFGFDDIGDVKIDRTLRSIADNKPVIVGMLIPTSFFEVTPGQQLWNPEEGEKILGGHAMVVIGYDLANGTIELMNSFGPDWGDDGFINMPKDDFARLVKYGFQIVVSDDITLNPQPTDQPVVTSVPLAGTFVFRYPKGYADNGSVNFAEAQTKFDEARNVYTLTSGPQKVNSVFQLIAKGVPEGKYVYAFSINPKNKTEIHWPQNNGMTDALKNVPLSQFVPSPDAEIVIPGDNLALQLEMPGEDLLCVLYSDRQIPDYREAITRVKMSTGDIQSRLRAGFGSAVVDAAKVDFTADGMSFRYESSSKEGAIVPLVLSVVAQ